jgi:soluble lytic murein transglycosylase-like protein
MAGSNRSKRTSWLEFTCVVTLLAGVEVVRAGDDQKDRSAPSAAIFPELPLPPPIDGAPEILPTFSATRAEYVALVRGEAREQGMPPDLADAVAFVESSYNPKAIGSVGEVGLMQIRPQTAAMLGYRGDEATLFQPEINVRYSVTYLAGAWRKADGDVCRTLMKYRAGHGEERMSPLSVEYCRRARGYLASIGSPLAQGALPIAIRTADLGGAEAPITHGRPPLVQAREQVSLRKLKGAEYWAAHERRVAAIAANLKRRGIVQ